MTAAVYDTAAIRARLSELESERAAIAKEAESMSASVAAYQQIASPAAAPAAGSDTLSATLDLDWRFHRGAMCMVCRWYGILELVHDIDGFWVCDNAGFVLDGPFCDLDTALRVGLGRREIIRRLPGPAE